MTGFHPRAKPVQGADGTLYGTASSGEGPVKGTMFKVQPDGSGFAVLRWFTNSMERTGPRYGLVLSGNTLYGTTESGGTAMNVVCYTNRFGQVIRTTYAGGVVFKVKTDGNGYTVLRNFGATNSCPMTSSAPFISPWARRCQRPRLTHCDLRGRFPPPNPHC